MKGNKNRKQFFDEKGMKAFGKKFKEVREGKGFSQQQLAIAADVAESQISRIEHGIINPTLSTTFKLAKILKVPLTELFDFKLPKEKE